MGKKIDTAGMWTYEGNPITRAGVFLYSGKAIDGNGSLGLDPQKLYPVLRPYEELLKAAESFNGKPIINDHEMIGTVEELTKPDEKNIGGTIYNVRPSQDQEGLIVADMTIFSDEIQQLVSSGKRELSCGYWCKYRPEVGTYNGQRYEFVQYDLEGNHIALVDNGRMGSGVRVFDAKEKTLVFDSMEMPKMKNKKQTLDADELRKEIAGLLKDASDEALAKCKDLLAPEKKEGDEDEDKGKKGEDENDPEKKEGDKEPEKKGAGDADSDKKGDGDEDEPEKKGEDEEPEKKDEEDEDEDKPKDKGEDSAPTMKQMLAEFSKREELYKSVEPLVGSFDHAEMTACEVAKYAAGKLGLATVDGAEVAIVQAHIAGRADGAKNVRAALDSSAGAEEGPSASLRKFLGE
jgi:hypothetical protein